MTGKLSAYALLAFSALALSACHQSSSSGDAAIPAANANVSTWGKYLADKGKLNNQGVTERAYNYVVPAGTDATAKSRRDSELNSITHGVGALFKSGGMLIIGGPDAQENTGFVKALGAQIKPGSMAGVVVLVVNNASEKDADSDALKATGATVRFADM